MQTGLQIYLLFPISSFCSFPADWSDEKIEYMNKNNWALTQVFIYHNGDFDQILEIPDCHGTILTEKHVLAKGSCVKGSFFQLLHLKS